MKPLQETTEKSFYALCMSSNMQATPKPAFRVQRILESFRESKTRYNKVAPISCNAIPSQGPDFL